MNKSDTIAAVILGAAAGVALLKFFNMGKEERSEFLSYIKDKTNHLLDDAEGTVERVEHYMDQIKAKDQGQVVDKLLVLKNMFKEFYGSEKHYLL